MKVVIVAKTRQGKGTCIGGLTFEGQSVRLVAADTEGNDTAGLEYEVGDVWQVEASPAGQLIPPHTENIIVHNKRKLPPLQDITDFIEQQMPPKTGGLDQLYDGLAQAGDTGALYIAKRSGVPTYSTMFWRPDHPLQRVETAKRIRYRYPTANSGRTLIFVGFQEPLETIPAGTLLRVSLSPWWRPLDDNQGEYRCYVQLSGWLLPTTPDDWWTSEPPYEEEEEYFPFHAPPAPAFQSLPPLPNQYRSPEEILKTVFGYDIFRPLQQEIIDNILARRDTLVVMPTGGGKSLCYQIPALLFDGLTVVVSPLISLMQDQVDQLREVGYPAVFLNSTLSYDDYLTTTNEVRTGQVKLLYVAPETLLRPETLVLLEQCRLDCLAIDEAHCISSWGHDFRPEYRRLLEVRDRFPQAVSVALTATATPRVQTDIKEILSFSDDNEFLASFDRPNLFLEVLPKENVFQQTLDFITAHPNQSGIIYRATRRQVDELSAALSARHLSVLPYHAGLDSATREENQTAFIHDDVNIIVATIAFGMGIDKPDVRFVLHVDLPKNIEHYYQQIGRSGRDGLRADCRLLFSYGDVHTQRLFIQRGKASEAPGREARLQALIGWAESSDCRRRHLLAYFGETYAAESCDMCDNCLREKVELVDLTVPAQKFLSCVYRTEQIFGMTHIINILRGSQAQAITKRGHHNLSTYGIGVEYSTRQWKHLARQFIQQNLLRQDQRHGSLKLTDKGWAVLKGEPFMGALEQARPVTVGPAGPTTYETALFEQLRQKRKALADAATLPPYAIFPDRSLQEMASYLPRSEGSFGLIHGVGQVKLERYAAEFLPVIRTYAQEHNLTEKPHPAGVPPQPKPLTGQSRSVAVSEAFIGGQSITDLADSYRVKQRTIISHLEKYQRAGHSLPLDRLQAESTLSDEELQQVLDAYDRLGLDRLRPIFDEFSGRIHYDELQLMRVIFRATHEPQT